MYAVVTTGGKQVKVSEGDTVRVERIDLPVGDTVTMNKVCLLVTDEGIVADPAALAKAEVVCDLVAQGRGKKIRIFKKKRRKGYAHKAGHRQAYTELRVREILAEPGARQEVKAEAPVEPEPEPAPEPQAQPEADAAPEPEEPEPEQDQEAEHLEGEQ